MADGATAEYQLVVLGSSAGGIDALLTILSSLPQTFPVPIVVAQHLDPRRESHLRKILGDRSKLPVRLVESDDRLEAGTVFVVPANRHVEINDHSVSVTPAGAVGPRPSVDRLLESAANAFGEGLIAVVLTGTGSDGTAGARHVKAMGGTVVIQNPETASFPEMPQSLAPTSVDIVANLDAIGPLLQDLLNGSYAPAPPTEDRTLLSFLAEIRERTGLDFASYKPPTIARRLQRRMLATGMTTLRDYVRFVHRNPEESHRLVASFLIKVTEFFRDADLFDYLRSELLPRLIETAGQNGNELRIWSAGCATGEEAYSLAILICEVLGDKLDSFNVRIFATDLDPDAVSFARRGIYPAGTVTTLPDSIVERYFSPTEAGDFEVSKRIRALTVFGQHDLGQRSPFPRIDLALCRNVLIYFTPDLQRRALQLFAFSLRDRGYLVLGKAETTTPLSESFVLENTRLKVFRRQGERILIPTSRVRDTGAAASRRALAGQARALHTQRLGRESQRPQPPGDWAETILLRLPVGVVTVDESYDVQSINTAARRLLSIHSEAVGLDLIHLAAQLPGRELRSAIDEALAGGSASRLFEMTSPDGAPPERRWLEASFERGPGEPESGGRLAVVVLRDVTESVTERTRLRDELERELERGRELKTQLERVSASYNELLRSNQEMTVANAELRSGNEELLVANEEVQAATEEVETLNEELQATNEELETLNEELQATVEELNTTNDDLQARTVELQELTATLEDQRRESEAGRARLEAVLRVMPEPIMVVDARGVRLLDNHAFEEAFPASSALEDGEGRALTGDNAVETRARRGSSFELEFSAPSEGGDRRLYVARGTPVAVDGRIVGSVITIEGPIERDPQDAAS